MKKALTTFTVVPLAVIALLIGLLFLSLSGGGSQVASCGGAALSVSTLPTRTVAPYSLQAMGRAAAILRAGRDAGVGFKGQMIALMTEMQESTLGDDPSTRTPTGMGTLGSSSGAFCPVGTGP